MARNDKTFLSLHKYLLNLEYTNKWEEGTNNKFINEILKHASKNKNGNQGLPDMIYVNENKQLLILIELKSNISKHKKDAIPEISHYLNCFNKKTYQDMGIIDEKINEAIDNLKKWNILGLAVSGDVETEYGYLIDTFYLKIDEIINLNIKEIHNEEEYMNLFENIDLEEISNRISKSSNWINNLLYDVKEDKRPTLLSIFLISLYPNSKKIKNHFIDDFAKYTPKEIMDNISIAIPRILGESGENIPKDKIDMIMREYRTFQNEKVLIETETVKTILSELKYNVIPLFQTKSNYDIIGKFYQEFLRYAGIVDVQSGIVLTPEHVTELFTNLIDLKKNDIILDSCCGTGSFLIAAMNRLLKLQSTDEERNHVKEKQLIGNELKSHMYILAISNMLFRGDGKSNILNYDFFTKEFDIAIQEKIKEVGTPTIGFINPPYSGSFVDYNELNVFKSKSSDKSKTKNKKPWMKEISFLEKMCRICSRYVVMIAPPQTFMGETEIRNRILENNTLKAVITMPKDLFQPNASTGSSIIIIETNKKHNFEKNVVFYNLESDGFELAKKKGRRDIYNKWKDIKKELLLNIDAPNYNNPKNIDSEKNCFVKIKENDEWLIQSFSKVDFNKIKESDFEKTIKEYIIFKTKKELDILEENINEVELLEILRQNKVSAESVFGDNDEI
ncbi:MAG: N-6 DNA methylase [Clostridia bacterium]